MKNIVEQLKKLGVEFPEEMIAKTIAELGLDANNLSDNDIEMVVSLLKEQGGGLAVVKPGELGSYDGEETPEAATILELVQREADSYSDWLADKITAITAGTTPEAIRKAKERSKAVNLDNFRQSYAPSIKQLFKA